MAKDYDYAGPSSGRRAAAAGKENHDRDVAARLQKELDWDLDEEADLSASLGRFDLSNRVGSGRVKGKGRAYTSTTKDQNMESKTSKSVHRNRKPTRQDASTEYPEPVRRALKDLQKWAKAIFATKCRKCETTYLMEDFDVGQYFASWMAKNGSKDSFSICSVVCPDEACGAETCLGCDRKPRLGKNTATVNGLELDWCCTVGAAFALWVVLCMYDEEELKIQLQSDKAVAANTPKPNMFNSFHGNQSKGTGYGAGYMIPGFSMFTSGLRPSGALNFQQVGEKTDDMTQSMLAIAIELLPEASKEAHPALCAMIQLSLLQDKAGALLRNDSLRNVTPRGNLYYAVFEWVNRLGKHPDLQYLVCDERYPKKRSAGIQTLSISETCYDTNSGTAGDSALVLCDPEDGMDPSLFGCMSNLATQSSNVISAAEAVSVEFQSRRVHHSQRRPQTKDKATLWQWYHQHHRVEFVPNMISFMRSDLAQAAGALTYSKPDRVRRIAVEIAEMSTSLPPNVFVRADEARPDCVKSLIVGPEGTPYQGGLFEFDILCGPQYPDQPPNVQFRTTGGGIVNFNPNLYPNGKVCLSLLNTWHGGSAEEKWIPGKSTLCSVLVSIQAMILCDHPIENEPGFEQLGDTSMSQLLEHKLQARTVNYAMLDWLRAPNMRNGLWHDVVKEYFAANSGGVLPTVRRWASQNPEIMSFRAPTQQEHMMGAIGARGTGMWSASMPLSYLEPEIESRNMPLQSDVTLNAAKFNSDAASEGIKKLNEALMEKGKQGPKWFEVGAQKYRQMRRDGETPLPVSTMLERAQVFTLPSREKGRNIPCRVMMPGGSTQPQAVFMHIHGGGWTLQSEADQDPVIAAIADGANVAVVSIGYRLAPEDPFPKGPEDCFDAAEWLVDNARSKFSSELQFLGGESAGGHLSLLTYFHLLSTRPKFRFSGLALNFGCFDLSFLPSVYTFKKPTTLILDKEIMEHYREAFCPGMSNDQLRDPSVSPFFRDLNGLELPPTLFTCGTEDPLLDDTVMMACRWSMHGGEAVVKVVPGAPHGYILFPQKEVPEAKEGLEAVNAFLAGKMRI
ncbi:MAG: hypothetical protein Q9195_001201 [Heterodermia aff. obscurata]